MQMKMKYNRNYELGISCMGQKATCVQIDNENVTPVNKFPLKCSNIVDTEQVGIRRYA